MDFLRSKLETSKLLWILALAALLPGRSQSVEFKDFFPTDYPAIEAKGEAQGSAGDDDSNLRDDLKKLTRELKSSVTYFAKRRTSTCLGSPCKIQAFPLVYTSQLSGFWGGLRTSILDITNTNPYRMKLTGMFVRSDSREWLSFLALDVPKFPFLFTDARVKLRADWSFSTEFQYYGIGDNWRGNLSEKRARYSLNQKDLFATVIFPLGNQNSDVRFGLLTAYAIEKFETDRFRNRSDTLLYVDRPEDYRGTLLNSYSLGLIIDSRDNEILTRSGQVFEIAAQRGFDSDDDIYNRVSIVDRRYLSRKRWTLAHRLSLDGIFGKAPFWKLRSVGGSDPIQDFNGSGILIGTSKGRYHDRFKIIESLEPRYRLRAFRFMGQLGEATFIPIGGSVGQFGPEFAWSAHTGMSVWWNRSLQLQLYYARSLDRNSLNLLFESEF